jgi:hypothetical protein
MMMEKQLHGQWKTINSLSIKTQIKYLNAAIIYKWSAQKKEGISYA